MSYTQQQLEQWFAFQLQTSNTANVFYYSVPANATGANAAMTVNSIPRDDLMQLPSDLTYQTMAGRLPLFIKS